jgi:hypothetical protein
VKLRDSFVLVGDGVKQSKEGKKIPGVKRFHQESENSSKAEYIWGHQFGAVGILVGEVGKRFCIPIALRLHDGVKAIFGWDDGEERQESHVVEMVKMACGVSMHFGSCILLLDSQYLSEPALQALDDCNNDGAQLQIVTKAKSNCAAYESPEQPEGKRKRGRPRIRGKKD